MRRTPFALLPTALAMLAGCTQFPALDRAADPAALAAPYPALLPFEALPALPATPPPDEAAALAAQAAALQARADLLRAAGG